jgi:hypothetical protein
MSPAEAASRRATSKIGAGQRVAGPVAGSLLVATTVRSQQPGSPIDACGAGWLVVASASGQQSGMRSPVNAQRRAKWLEVESAKTNIGATKTARSQRVHRAFDTSTG